MMRAAGFFLALIVLSTPTFADRLASSDVNKIKALQKRSIDTLLDEINFHYPTAQFKEKLFGITIEGLRTKYKKLIQNAQLPEEALGLSSKATRPVLSKLEFQQVLIAMAAEFHDGHLNISRLSNDFWTLGLKAAAIGNGLYVSGYEEGIFDKDATSMAVNIGDEIVSLNGVSVQELAKINLLYVQTGSQQTALGVALESTVNARGWNSMPKTVGASVNVIFRKADGRTYDGIFRWSNREVTNEERHMFSLLHPEIEVKNRNVFAFGGRGTPSHFLEGMKALDSASIIDLGKLYNHELMDEKSHSPNPVHRLKVFLIRHKGKNIGVFRFPGYDGKAQENELLWLREMVRRLEAQADVLIIDHLLNSGGSDYYSSQLLSLFADQPMQGLRANVRLSEAYTVGGSDPADRFKTGYVETKIDHEQARRWKTLLDSGVSQVENVGVHDSQTITRDDRHHGIIIGKPGRIFSKPIILLNDQRSASNGDMVPAVFQYNKRALIIGEKSAGLGGCVFRELPSVTPAEVCLRVTFREMLLPDGSIIENVGVIPDVARPILPADLQERFSTYSKQILNAAVALSQGRSLGEIQEIVSSQQQALERERFNAAKAEISRLTPDILIAKAGTPYELLHRMQTQPACAGKLSLLRAEFGEADPRILNLINE